MAGFGDCRCCKKYKKLTTYHNKQINQKVYKEWKTNDGLLEIGRTFVRTVEKRHFIM